MAGEPTRVVTILTLFPEILKAAFGQSILLRAQRKGLFEPRLIDIRDYARDKHRTVDDKPYGGGSGMVMKVEPIARALAAARRAGSLGKVYLLTPTGRRFDQAMAQEMAQAQAFTLLCGRYEGIDQRVEDHLCDGAISVGDYVLSGGEPAAYVVVDAVMRLVPGVLGAGDSALLDSFSGGLLDYPHYTRPPRYRSWQVPKELLSGHHHQVTVWRREQQIKLTEQRRPDLIRVAESKPHKTQAESRRLPKRRKAGGKP
ncbi:MAG: tRNA (guanosine(37)-N1)-methyltransferase TrmD [candidate division FCPU426 bacterium]